MEADNRHIFILTFDYPPNNGGIARLTFELKKGLELKGLDVTVIAPQADSTDHEDDKNVVRVSEKRGKLERQARKYLKKHANKNDIIITGTFHPEGMLSESLGLKTYILAHGAEYLPGDNFFRKRIWPSYRSHVLKKADMVIANSHYTEGLVKSCSPKARTIAVPLAVDVEHFHPSCKKNDDGFLHLCTISRLEKFKGQDFIIKTIADLPESYKQQVRLHIGGKGSYKTALEDMVKNLGLGNVVSFEGFIDDNRLCDFYSSSHVFILCTREEPANRNVEGFGLVFTEAQACGTAVIGTRAGGIPDAIDEGNGGWLIGQDSEVELRKLLISLIDDRSLSLVQGEKARQRMVSEMTWERYTEKICNIIL